MSADNRERKRLIPIPDPIRISQANTIPEPLQTSAPMPIPNPSVLPSSTDAVLSFTFEEGNRIGWLAVDEPLQLLGGEGPSRWDVVEGPISGKALVQASNIWGDKNDTVALGTFLVYDLQEWTDFIMELDFFARDNDGVGVVWGWKDRLNHYRFLTMIDPNNPTNAPPDKHAPFSMIEKRIGDAHPYYNTLNSKREACYRENEITHIKLEVVGGTFKVYSNNRIVLEAKDVTYRGGKVGFTLYAHNNIFFDNVRIEPLASYPFIIW